MDGIFSVMNRLGRDLSSLCRYQTLHGYPKRLLLWYRYRLEMDRSLDPLHSSYHIERDLPRERVLWYLSKYLEDYWEFVFNRDIAMLISPFWYWYIIPLNVWFLERDIKLISNESLEREREYCGISLEIYQYHLRFLVKILQSPRTGYLVSDIASEISLAIIIPWIFRERYLYHQLSQEK